MGAYFMGLTHIINMYLSLENITVKYGKFVALNDITLGIQKGDRFGLIGANGSGKTTLLKIVIGLLNPNKGKILLNGKEIKPTKKEIRKILGYCPQQNSFFEQLTVKENLKFFANLYDVKGDLNKLATSLAKSLNLHEKIDVFASNLSGGMKRRLNIGCSLTHNPQILLLDEPTIELDPFSRMTIWNLIKKINQQGTTVIVSTNVMEEANFLCNNVIFLVRGNIRYFGRPQEITKLINRYVWSE
ncbi:MAG: ABC transporter ATP-binding protein [Candidatus Aenigmatarchaeota archaeon]|nr:ABC transporter ATP-binding protein [Nanoarchaeota archaeon]